MVDRTAKGQLLERPVVLPLDDPAKPDACLDGIYLRGTEPPPLVIASPHPLLGGSMTNPVVNELAYAAARAARASLRLDYRGVGASEGTSSEDVHEAARDLRAGIDFLVETTGFGQVALAGYSFGAWVVLVVARSDPRVDRVLVVAPPRKALPPEERGVPGYAELAVPVHVVVGGEDPLADPGREQELVAGAKTARVTVLRGADHSFRASLVELARVVPVFLGAAGRDVARGEG